MSSIDQLPVTDESTARQRAWLASILLRSQQTWFGRFSLQLQRLVALGRGQRRRLQRKAAVSLAGAALVLSLGAGLMAPMTVHAASITVDDGVVIVADDGQCSLIEAILNANSDTAFYATGGECLAGSGDDTITLPTNGLFTLTGSYSYQYYSETGLPSIDTTIIIEGNGSEITRDGAAPDFRIMAVSATGDLTLNNTTISNGYSEEDGGGLYNYGTMRLQGSTLTGNEAYDDGGGVENDGGTLTIDNSTISDNVAGEYGGGVANEDGGTLMIINGSQITGNYAAVGGGGVQQDFSGGPLTITDSTISGNEAFEYGGGLVLYGDSAIVISNSDISGNLAYVGGGIATYAATDVTIQNGTTISDNTAYFGGGADLYVSTVTIADTTISGNTAFYSGGGIHSDGSNVTIERSIIKDHVVPKYSGGLLEPSRGGGIYNGSATVGQDQNEVTVYGNMTIVDSTISGNSAAIGGGIINTYFSELVVENTTINRNAAYIGGGLANLPYGKWLMTNSTVSGNQATNGQRGDLPNSGGGGIWNWSSFEQFDEEDFSGLILSTVTGNSAEDYGGGIYNAYGPLVVFGSLVTGNVSGNAGHEIYQYTDNSAIVFSGYSILGDDSETTAEAFNELPVGGPNLIATSDDANIPLTDILDTTLADNGGPTATHALVSGSPAIDQLPEDLCAPNSLLGFDLDHDQRGEPRNVDIPGTGNDGGSPLCDIGAFELQEEVAGFCPVDPAVGYLRTDVLGTGQGSPTKGARTRKLVIPNYQDVDSLYGQLAAVESGGVMKYVRFRYPDNTKVQIHDATSLGYRAFAVSWWGSELDTGYKYVKGQFFWGKKGNKMPRAYVLWPTYDTDEPYANVFTPFDESIENHVAWETSFIATQTQTIAIPETQDDGATVNVSVALVDVNDDARSVILTVTAGNLTETRVITTPNSKDLLNLETFELVGVDAGTDEVVITLESPVPSNDFPFGGDSAAMIGAAVNYECGESEPPIPPDAPTPDARTTAFSWASLLGEWAAQPPASSIGDATAPAAQSDQIGRSAVDGMGLGRQLAAPDGRSHRRDGRRGQE